jgi:hypothetical protein
MVVGDARFGGWVLGSQLVGWRELGAFGVYLCGSHPRSTFFYLATALPRRRHPRRWGFGLVLYLVFARTSGMRCCTAEKNSTPLARRRRALLAHDSTAAGFGCFCCLIEFLIRKLTTDYTEMNIAINTDNCSREIDICSRHAGVAGVDCDVVYVAQQRYSVRSGVTYDWFRSPCRA